jgi:hypothetical protein
MISRIGKCLASQDDYFQFVYKYLISSQNVLFVLSIVMDSITIRNSENLGGSLVRRH